MITKIDISKFGLFKDYSWNTEIGSTETFRRLNVIYGRNYSGKTTLSRIFKCIEDFSLHKNYTDCGFSITLSDGTVLTNLQIRSNYKVRVYNTDFVKENLNWLHNDDGTIRPFTILGSKNIELDKQIIQIELKLGNIDEKKGLFYENYQKTIVSQIQLKDLNTKCNSLEDKLRNRANDKIKVDSNLFIVTPSKRTYTITDIKNDISSVEKNISAFLLNTEMIDERKKLLKETSKPNINLLPETGPKFSKYYTQAKELLSKKIKPSIPIVDLLNDHLLQEWVRQGVDRHKGKRTECGFCGNPLGDDLWSKLDEHFSRESEELREQIKNQIDNLKQAKQKLSEFFIIHGDLFYASLAIKFEDIYKDWTAVIKIYDGSLDKIIFELKEREKDIFKAREIPEIADVSESISNNLKAFNGLISTHNSKTNTLSADQQIARIDLRKADVAQFITDIDYNKETLKIAEAEAVFSRTKENLSSINEQIETLSEEKRMLEAQAKDESKGAELVNHHLTHFFGHNELKLVAEGTMANIKFKIQRDNVDANNLSEGECSLISFCYFVAKMEDELKDDSNSNKLLIYVDDPISSLDSNHIFFMYSLIESIIAKPKKYRQLFISTHNLDFLKYLKKLTIPKWKPQPNSGDKPDIKYFIIDRKSKGCTLLKLAPDYLKNYITEFNYLFNEIYKSSISNAETLSHHYQYNFGNNMRKFLEAYLFYKYPNHKLSHDERLKKFFNSDSVSITLVNRVINEYSHIGEQFDRGMHPIDIDEIGKISGIVLSKIKELDPDQYEALVESIQ